MDPVCLDPRYKGLYLATEGMACTGAALGFWLVSLLGKSHSCCFLVHLVAKSSFWSFSKLLLPSCGVTSCFLACG